MMRSLSAALLLTVSLALAGCYPIPPERSVAGGEAGPQSRPQSAKVSVERRTISSTLVVEGSITANPAFVIVSPQLGVIDVSQQLRVGGHVKTGDLLASVDGEDIVAPSGGRILEVLQSTGSQIAKNIPIVVVEYSGFGVEASIPPDLLYRLYEGPLSAKVNVEAGPSGVDCQIQPTASAPLGDGASERSETGTVVMCLLPLKAEVASGLTAKMGLDTGTRNDVLTLPVQAVSGSAGKGVVQLVNGDSSKSITVSLGITDGSFIEIVDGLGEGDVVLGYAPGLGQ